MPPPPGSISDSLAQSTYAYKEVKYDINKICKFICTHMHIHCLIYPTYLYKYIARSLRDINITSIVLSMEKRQSFTGLGRSFSQ